MFCGISAEYFFPVWKNCEDMPERSELPWAFVFMEFTDTALLFEESPLEDFDINTHGMQQVFDTVFLIQKFFFSLYIKITGYVNVW